MAELRKIRVTKHPIAKDATELEQEKSEILKRYRALLRSCKPTMEKDDKKLIRLAFDTALNAHEGMRRRTGEPYIFHPLAVARIVTEEMGLGTTSVVGALLHDTVEDTNITLEDIEDRFGKTIAKIVDGLTKISGVFDQGNTSMQAENFRKVLLTLSDDVRVILIKIADRLHNMRTLEMMPRNKQLKIAGETAFIYAPLAHRLGFYAIKNELEDLAMKYTEPQAYQEITGKLHASKKEHDKFINDFTKPLIEEFKKQGFNFEIKGRPKSIHSIWEKMKRQQIPFEEVYDLFAIRIIIDTLPEKEKADCWRIYSIVTDYYVPNPDRLRDWISTPKANGYESLHTTVMSSSGKWVEVQIRTRRMDEIAEMGYAAHWKYKEGSAESALDEWVAKIRELLESPEGNALDFVDDFKLNLFSEEIFVFTPKGDLRTLPHGSTALDFAFDIHTDIGSRCIGAKVNHRLVPISHKLTSGDQIEIITSEKQYPKEDWLSIVVTAKAKGKIKDAVREHRKRLTDDGKEIFDKKLRQIKVVESSVNMNNVLLYYKVATTADLYYRVAMNVIDLHDLREALQFDPKTRKVNPRKAGLSFEELVKQVRGNNDALVIGEDIGKIAYKLSSCCKPIPGDDVFGFITSDEGIIIHRTNCPNAIKLMSNYAFRIVKAKWTGAKEIAFLTGVRITGVDDVGVVNHITKVISSELKVNMRSISIESTDGLFEGTIMLFVLDTKHLNTLMKRLRKLKGIMSVSRID